MSYHIRCLDAIILLCAIGFPSTYIFFLSAFKIKKGLKTVNFSFPTILVYSILALVILLSGKFGELNLQFSWQLLIGIAVGIFSIIIEFFEAQLNLYLTRGRFTKSIKPPSVYVERFSILSVIFIIVAVAAEEIVFRQIIINSLALEMGIGVIGSICLSSILYGLNHVYFSSNTVLQKLITGAIYSALFVLSGYNILLPVIAHSTQNLVLYAMGSHSYSTQGGKNE